MRTNINLFSYTICHDLISKTLTYAYWYELLRLHGPLLQENGHWAESCDPATCRTRNARDYVVHCLSVTKRNAGIK